MLRYPLVNEEIWDENEAIFQSMPRCSACDKYGHNAASCREYRGAARDPSNLDFTPADHFAGRYVVEKVGRTSENDRVVRINGQN